jgi:hypothetical protein
VRINLDLQELQRRTPYTAADLRSHRLETAHNPSQKMKRHGHVTADTMRMDFTPGFWICEDIHNQ